MRREPQGRCGAHWLHPRSTALPALSSAPSSAPQDQVFPEVGLHAGTDRKTQSDRETEGAEQQPGGQSPSTYSGTGLRPRLPVTWTAVWCGLGCLMAISLGVDSHELTMEATGKERGWGRVRRVEGPSARGQKPSADKEAVLRGGPEGQRCHTVLVLAF